MSSRNMCKYRVSSFRKPGGLDTLQVRVIEICAPVGLVLSPSGHGTGPIKSKRRLILYLIRHTVLI